MTGSPSTAARCTMSLPDSADAPPPLPGSAEDTVGPRLGDARIVLLDGDAEAGFALLVRLDEEQPRAFGRIERGGDRVRSGRGDRGRRQTGLRVGVVGAGVRAVVRGGGDRRPVQRVVDRRVEL